MGYFLNRAKAFLQSELTGEQQAPADKLARQGCETSETSETSPAMPGAGKSIRKALADKHNGQNANYAEILGMSVDQALEVWRSEGAPVIHLGPGENSEDLAKLLSYPNVSERHLKAVRLWLEKVLKRRGES